MYRSNLQNMCRSEEKRVAHREAGGTPGWTSGQGMPQMEQKQLAQERLSQHQPGPDWVLGLRTPPKICPTVGIPL